MYRSWCFCANTYDHAQHSWEGLGNPISTHSRRNSQNRRQAEYYGEKDVWSDIHFNWAHRIANYSFRRVNEERHNLQKVTERLTNAETKMKSDTARPQTEQIMIHVPAVWLISNGWVVGAGTGAPFRDKPPPPPTHTVVSKGCIESGKFNKRATSRQRGGGGACLERVCWVVFCISRFRKCYYLFVLICLAFTLLVLRFYLV